MFKLPPIQETEDEKPQDESITDLSEGDSSFDEKSRSQYNRNIQAIDVTSSHFQSLPADIRHEILSDIKETRKQSSWNRLHELPVESGSFSDYQMKRLLKRRKVQVGLEEAEKEMGGKGLSLVELENLLSEKGVVDPELATKRVASNEHIRFLHVRDIKKAIEKDEAGVKTEKISPLAKAKVETKIELSKEEIDLQKAIQLSLGYEVDDDSANSDDTVIYGEANSSSEAIKMTEQQRKALGFAATKLARSYMLEYGGLNDDYINELIKPEDDVELPKEFK